MYYRYKVKKKKKGYAKGIVIIILLAASVYCVYHFRSHLFFWRYTFNKIEARIHAVELIPEYSRREKVLEELVDIVDHYSAEHEGDSQPCFMAGHIHYLYGESLLGRRFSQILIAEDEFRVSDKARDEFLKAIRNVKKGLALKESNALDEGYALILARAAYYSSFETPAEILAGTLASVPDEAITDIEDIRFITVLNILAGQNDRGIQYLTRKGMKPDDIESVLFLATCQKMASMFTGAIMTYRDVIARTNDIAMRKLAFMNLGKIYFNQSLYMESIDAFANAFQVDASDQTPKIWMGRNYFAQGNRDRAKAVWLEVLAVDKDNAEVKELLQVM